MNRRFCALATIFAMLFSCIPVGAVNPATQGVSQFANSYIPVLLGDAKKDGPDWLTRTDLQLRFDSLLNPQYGIETVQPLGVLPSGQAFWQGKLATDGVGAKPTLNLGLGYRTLKGNGTELLGVNGFYDNSFETGFSRIGLGGEFFMGNFEARANAYIPVSGSVERSRTATDKTMEQAVKGVDFEVGGALPKAPWAEVFAGGNTLLHEHSDNVTSLTARTQLQLTPHVRLEAGYQANPDNKYVKLGYTLGPSGRVSMIDMKKSDAQLTNLSNKLLQKVERDNIVRTETWTEKITGGVTGYVFGSGAALVIRASSTAPAGYTAVNGATVSVQGQSISTSTDSTGHFTLKGIPIGTVTIVATSGALSVSGSVTVTEGSAAQTPDIGTVSTVGVLSGFVYRNGNVVIISDSQVPPSGFTPVESGTVTITGQDGTPIAVTTDASGHFVAPEVPAGEATITADDGAGHTAETSATVEAGSTETTPSAPDPVGIVEGYLYSNGHGSVIIGSTATPADYYTALSGFTVRIQGKPSLSSTTGVDGHFLIANVPAGSQNLEAVSGGASEAALSGAVTVFANQTTAASVGAVVIPGTLFGYAYLDDATGLQLRLTNTNTAPSGYHAADGSTLVLDGAYNIVLAADGNYVKTPIWPGNHTLVFDRNSDGAVLSETIHFTVGVNGATFTPTGNYTLTDSTPATGSIEGYVFTSGTDLVVQPGSTAPQGYWKLSGVTVRLGVNLSVSGASTTTDANGFFHFVDFPVADYQIDFAKSGFTTASSSVSITKGATASLSVNIPKTTVSLQGYTFTDGTNIALVESNSWIAIPVGAQAVSGATVSLQNTPLQATSAGNGMVSLAVVPGTYTVSVAKTGLTGASGSVTIAGSAWVNVGSLPRGSIQGYAFVDNATQSQLHLDTDGTAPVGFSADLGMTIRDSNGFGGGVNGDGSYSIYGVAGTHSITFHNETGVNYTTSVNVVTNSTSAPADYDSTGSVEGYVFHDATSVVIRTLSTPPTGYTAVNGATVTIGGVTGTTNASGYFKVSYIASGVGVAISASDGTFSVSGTVSVISNTTSPSGNFGTANGHTGGVQGCAFTDGLNIIVRSSDSVPGGYAPAAGAVVSIDGFGGTATVNPTGYFILEGIPEGSQMLRVTSGSLTVSGSVTITANSVGSFNFGTVNDHVSGVFRGYAFTSGTDIVVQPGSTAPQGYWPLQGAQVTNGTYFAVTDSTGYFSLRVDPAGTYTVSVQKTGYTSATATLTVSPEATVDVTIGTPKTAYNMTGYLITDGTKMRVVPGNWWESIPVGAQFVGGATVILEGTGRSTTTDSSGSITFTGVPASYTLTAMKTGYTTLVKSFTLGSANAALDLGDPLTTGTVTGYAFVNGTNLHLDTDGTAPDGFAPAAGMTVKDIRGFGITVQANGAYSFSAVPGSRSITFSNGTVNYTTQVDVTANVTSAPPDYDTPPQFGNVEGYVLNDGSNIIINASWPTGYQGKSGITVSIGAVSAISDGNGYFLLSNVPAGTGKTLTATKSGLISLSGTMDVLANTTTTAPDMGVPNAHGGSVTGYLFSDGINVVIQASSTPPAGYAPVDGIQVIGAPDVGYGGSCSPTFMGGRIYLPLMEGPATISLSYNGIDLSARVTILVGQTVNVPLAGTGNVQGYVYGNGSAIVVRSVQSAFAGYSAIQNATVSFGGSPVATTDSSGYFKATKVPGGSQNLTATYGAFNEGGNVDVTPGTTVNSPNFGTVKGSIRGYVYVDGTNPTLNDIFVSHFSSGPAGYTAAQGATVNVGGETAITDASGAFTVTNVPSGTQTVTVQWNSLNPVSGSVDASAGQTVDVTDFPNLVLNKQIGTLPGTVMYSITITKPGYYKIITSEYMTAANTVLDLFDSSWNKIASNDDYLDAYSYIRWYLDDLNIDGYTIAVRDAAGGNITCRLEVVEDP